MCLHLHLQTCNYAIYCGENFTKSLKIICHLHLYSPVFSGSLVLKTMSCIVVMPSSHSSSIHHCKEFIPLVDIYNGTRSKSYSLVYRIFLFYMYVHVHCRLKRYKIILCFITRAFLSSITEFMCRSICGFLASKFQNS